MTKRKNTAPRAGKGTRARQTTSKHQPPATQGKPPSELERQAARLPFYSPEVEALRPQHRQQAEALIKLLDVEQNHVAATLDIDPPGVHSDEPKPNILWNAIQAHIHALFECVLHTYDADFLRTLYVELRLYYDEQMHKQKARERAAAQAAKGAQN